MASNQPEPAPSDVESATRLGIDIRQFPWIRRLAADYAHDFPALSPFFSGNPAQAGAWPDAIARTRAHARRGAAIAAVIAAQQERRQAPPEARASAQRLADDNTVAVVTGQQAGLFGGPLFTLLKALTAIKLAERVTREHHVPAVAVFWVDAEDHDWNEVRACTVFDDSLSPVMVSLPPRSGEPARVADVLLDASVDAALDQLERVLPATEFRSGVVSALRGFYTPGTDIATAFARWMEHVLGSHGLIVFDSSDPAAKGLARDVFAREVSRPCETGRLAGARGTELAARGYHAQAQPAENTLAIFELNGGRRAVRRHDGGFNIGDREEDGAALLERVLESPASFSPNVLLRPIVQDTLFPTVCYVAGPSELAYLGQLGPVYAHFGLPMPLIHPRASATLVDSAALRFLQKSRIGLESLQPQDESALNALLRAQIPPAVDESFSAATLAIDTAMGRLAQVMPLLDPTLEGAAKNTLGRMQHDLSSLQGKMIQAAKRRDETLRRQYTRARALMFPGGHPQERAIGFVSFLNQYGPALVERLHQELSLDFGQHWIVVV